MGDDRDGRHRHENEYDGVQREGTDVRAEVAVVGVDRRGVEKRRKEDNEDDVRVELRVRDARPGTKPSRAPPMTSTIG
jgi:hypothetical protein